jgi:hypothetical protein
MTPLSSQQRLNLVNTGQLFAAWKEAKAGARHYRYGMHWKRIRGREYLYRPIDAAGNARSLGPRSPETERVRAEFDDGRQRNAARLAELEEKLEEQSRLNRALRINRVRNIAARVLRKLAERDALLDFRVIGTFALYAYEARAGVLFLAEVLASGDVDLAYDPRKKLTLVTAKLASRGLLGVLQDADASFRKLKGQSFRAANDAGFMVDLIVPASGMRPTAPVHFAEADLEASEAPGLQWLLNAPAMDVVAIAEDGRPVEMRVPDPRAFAVHKLWLSRQPGRDALKRPRDAQQAKLVAQVTREQLTHLPFEREHLRFFPLEVARDMLDGLQTRD